MKYRVDHQPLREVVAGQIRAMILDRELAQGSRLVEAHLAEKLGVSRNPVREAIRSLEASGLVDVVPRKGACVCVIDHAEVRQIQEIRLLIEGHAAERAALLRNDEHLVRLRECLERGRAATKGGDTVGAAAWHRDFYLVIEEAAANPFLGQVLNSLRHRTELVFSLVVDERGEITWQEHDAISQAIADGDGDSANRLVREHIISALETFEGGRR